eukprot:2231339-Amphidinium_carterae.1
MRAATSFRQRPLSDEEVFVIRAAMLLLRLPPREVNVTEETPPWWVFTDAAATPCGQDEQHIAVGGVLYEPGN